MAPIKRVSFNIGRHVFSAYFYIGVDHYVDKATIAEIKKWIGEHGLEDGKISRIRAVRALTGWGLPQSKLWVELHYPK